MKVAFLASHSQRKSLQDEYALIRDWLEKKGFDLYCGRVFDEQDDMLEDEDKRIAWYKKSIDEIKRADLVVIEISYPSSANIGHILTFSINIGKAVIALYKRGRDPIFLRGWKEEKFILAEYYNDVTKTLEESFDYALDKQDTRFNFFISPKIGNFLDWVSKKKKLPRAVYLRKLIEEDMKKNREFEE